MHVDVVLVGQKNEQMVQLDSMTHLHVYNKFNYKLSKYNFNVYNYRSSLWETPEGKIFTWA